MEDPPGAGANTIRITYRLAGQMVAVRSAGALYYTYTDHLGNVVALGSTTGGILAGSSARYDPFGNYRTAPATNPGTTSRGFTGHVHNNTGVYPTQNVGLIYMNARYYLPEIGRFISPDSIVPQPGEPQSYNRYSYSYNNPVKYTDPSGYCVTNEQEITRGDAYDCTVEEMAELTWETRKWWMEMFMRDSGVEWFYNILGILDYFAGDSQFSPLDGWASLSDAGVLIAIQDGWRQFNGEHAINASPIALAASNEWTKFFNLRRDFGDDDSSVASQWGVAEQAGVNFGVAIAEPLKAESDVATQIEIDTFVASGNVYRSLISNHADKILPLNMWPAPYFDPRTNASRGFVNWFSRHIISPAASALWGQYLAGPGRYFNYGYFPY